MGDHHKIKLAAVLDFNKCTGVDRSDQMPSYYSFESKTIKCWKKLFFHLFDLVVVNAHILHNKTSKKNISLEVFYERVAEGLLASVRMEIQMQDQTSSPAGRLLGKDHFLYSIPVTCLTGGRISVLMLRVCRDKQASDQENCEEMRYSVLP